MTSTEAANRRPTLDAALIAGLAITLAVVVTFHDWIVNRSLESLSQGAVLVALLCYVVVVRQSPFGAWSLGGMFLLLLLLFHFGDLVIIATGASFSADDRTYVNLWLYSGLVPEAIYLSILSAVGFALTYATLTSAGPGTSDEAAPEDRAIGRTLGATGAVLTCGGVAVYFLRALIVAPGLLLSTNYAGYNDALGGDRVISFANLAITLGVVLAAAAPKGPARTAALVGFLVFAAVLLPLGVRTATLFPAAAGAVAAARRHKMPSGWKTFAVILAGLALIGLVREVRTDGPEPLSLSAANPVSSLAETGGTLRTVAETVRWDAVYNEDRRHGLTYVAPLLRLKERVMGEGPPEPDDRLPGTLMQRRVMGGQFGYSAVAEAYLNFGRWGVLAVFALLGALAGRLDGWSRGGVTAAAVAGLLMAALGLTVRNTFIAFPSIMIAGLAVIYMARIWSLSGASQPRSRFRSPSPDRSLTP